MKIQIQGASASSDDLNEIKTTVKTLDSLTQSACAQIAAVAKLALCALETHEGHRNPEMIAGALEAILSKAGELSDSVSYEAAEIDCNHFNERFDRRVDAMVTVRREYRDE